VGLDAEQLSSLVYRQEPPGSVRIGEAGDEVVLSREPWNELVRLIRDGAVREL
jgi:hypothetical protein